MPGKNGGEAGEKIPATREFRAKGKLGSGGKQKDGRCGPRGEACTMTEPGVGGQKGA